MIDHSLEQTILGSMCQYEECLTTGMLRLKPEHFDNSLHKKVFEIMQSMNNEGKCVDVVTVASETKKLFKDKSVTWLVIKESYVSAAAFDHLVDKLIKLYQLRTLHRLAQNIVEKVNSQTEPDEITELIEREIYAASGESKLNIINPHEHAIRMLETLSSRIDRKSNGGIKTSYSDLNKALNGGFEPGQLIIIAAQTGKGKTAYAMNLMRDIAVTQKIPALYINTEMSEEQVDVRWMTLLGLVDHYKIATGQLSEEEHKRVMFSLDKMNGGGFHSINEPDLTLNKLISICRKFKAKTNCKFIVVDYIGRMDTLDPKLQEWQVLKTAAKRLKTIAQELELTVLMLAQVNENEKLEGARAMKNECDLYAYLRPMNDSELNKFPGNNYCLAVEKNRSGPTKNIPLTFYGNLLTFKGEDNNVSQT